MQMIFRKRILTFVLTTFIVMNCLSFQNHEIFKKSLKNASSLALCFWLYKLDQKNKALKKAKKLIDCEPASAYGLLENLNLKDKYQQKYEEINSNKYDLGKLKEIATEIGNNEYSKALKIHYEISGIIVSSLCFCYSLSKQS